MNTEYLDRWRGMTEEEKYAEWSRVFEQSEEYGDYVFFCNYVDLLTRPTTSLFSLKNRKRKPFWRKRA